MQRSRISNPEHLQMMASPTWSPCEGLIKDFEEAWQQGKEPTLGEYLRAEGPQRQALLVELVHVDLEFRLKSGRPARIETYLDAYPELATDRLETLELIAAEYELRNRYQGNATLDEYHLRFPDHVDHLRKLLSWAKGDTLVGVEDAPAPSSPVRWPVVPGYEIVEEIGRGGMGVLYKAYEPHLGRHVALKFLPPEYARDQDRLERFLREARTASALNHPHICTVHALGEHQGHPFIVMEFIEGLTLRTLLADRPGVEEVARWVAQAARALAAAHEANVVHRDIKPENVMVRQDGYVKVLDFGLARRLPTLAPPDPRVGRAPSTEPGVLVGTVGYMSPEQAAGTPADRASDIFSLGIVLYQLATGTHPFETDSALATLHAITTQQPVSPSRLNPSIPAALEGLIEAMLHKDARLRPTAAEVEATLEGLTDQGLKQPVRAPASRLILHRELELETLREALADAEAGRGSLVCVSGEPGIGKTTLVEDFLDQMAESGRACRVARGHCSERLAGTEAYLPVIDALEDLLRGEGSDTMARVMKVVAPSWYLQVAPTAHHPSAPDPALASRAPSQPAMLREFCSFLQEATRRGPLVLFFDDMHWADVSTVDLIAHLGRHCQGLGVLVIVTYRPTELLLGPHPFHRVKLELQGKGICTELSVGFLDREQINRYLALVFPGHAFPANFADLIHSRTEGSPLFMVDLLRYLQERGAIAAAGGKWSLERQLPDLWQELPESLRSMIQRLLERLDEADRQLLAAASVQGHEFDSATVASALQRDAAEVEERLQVLDRVHGLVRQAREYEFPDRTLTLGYAFVHILYQQALYTALPPNRRAALSVALARTLEAHHGEGCPEMAAKLACLYEVGRDLGKAARQFCLAARNAAQVFAHREAVVLARRGIRLLTILPETAERAALELPLQTTLGMQLQVTQGFAAPEAKQAYSRARQLCRQAPDSAPLFPVLWGLWLFSKVRSELARAQEMADELLDLARALQDPDLALQAQQALGMTAFCRGLPAVAIQHVEKATALYDPERHRIHAFEFGQDPSVICKAYGAVALWLLGYPDQAQRQSDAAIQASRELSPSSQTVALHFAAMVHQLTRDGTRVRLCAEVSTTIAAEHGFSFWLAGGTVMKGWALADCGAVDKGLIHLRDGLRDWSATGSITYQTYYLGLLAEVLGQQGQTDEAKRVLAEAIALAEQTGEGLVEAELYRLQGEMILAGAKELEGAALQQAEENFQKALEIARRQETKSLELRTAMSLARLSRRTGKTEEACKLLADTYNWFTEGFQTPDLVEAKQQLGSMN